MTRATPTQAEIICGNALRQYLENGGSTISSFEFSDQPDLRFRSDGILTGCECVQIPPERIYRFVQTRFKNMSSNSQGLKAARVVWPVEPHTWMQEAIADKERHIHRYQSNVNSIEIDLLVHTPVDSSADMVKTSSPHFMVLLQWAANFRRSRFRKVYFWSAATGIVQLAPSESHLQKPVLDFSLGYPTDGYVMSSAGPFKTTAEGESPIEYDFGEIEPAVIIIPPTSAEFQKHRPNFTLSKLRCRVIASATGVNVVFQRV